jgi:hypothetical protein
MLIIGGFNQAHKHENYKSFGAGQALFSLRSLWNWTDGRSGCAPANELTRKILCSGRLCRAAPGGGAAHK